jgi:hypothetical protein
MGDDIGSGSVTDCRLRSFSNHRQHTQQCTAVQSCTTAKIKTNTTRTDVITRYLPSLALLTKIDGQVLNLLNHVFQHRSSDQFDMIFDIHLNQPIQDFLFCSNVSIK